MGVFTPIELSDHPLYGLRGPSLSFEALGKERGVWKERYYVLKNRRLFLYDDAASAKPTETREHGEHRGWVDAVGWSVIVIEEERDGVTYFGVEVEEECGVETKAGVMPPGKFVLSTTSKAARDSWATAFSYARRPTWILDSDPRARECMENGVPFSTFRRRHHCRRCGGVFCSEAMTLRALPELRYRRPVKVCVKCNEGSRLVSQWVVKVPRSDRPAKGDPFLVRCFNRLMRNIPSLGSRQPEPPAPGPAKSPRLRQQEQICDELSKSQSWLSFMRKREIDTEGWEKGDVLGRGTFGVVYKGILKSGMLVAVKEMYVPPLEGEDDDFVFIQQEMELMRRLNHPNICKFYGAEMSRDGRWVHLFMELVSGGSLSGVVRRRKQGLGEPVVWKHTRDILQGLSYLHSHSVVHRDVKGDNVLISEDGTAKLADFGTARRIYNTAGAQTVAGTPYWMAPEILNNVGYNEKADIWSTGITVVESLTGKPPWPMGIPLHAVYALISSGTHPQIPSGFSDACRDFLERCFVQNPAERPSACALLRHKWLE